MAYAAKDTIFKRAYREYKRQLASLYKLLETAKEHEFPADHIYRIEHLIAEVEGVISIGDNIGRYFPRRAKAGRPFSHEPSYSEMCDSFFRTVWPVYSLPKKVKPKEEPAPSKKIAVPTGLTFDFTKK